jgi:hypothetical protein
VYIDCRGLPPATLWMEARIAAEFKPTAWQVTIRRSGATLL